MIIKYILLLLTLSTYLLAIETIHSSLSAYAESKTYTGSQQKIDGMVYGFGADIHYGNAEYKLTYEEGGANTKGLTHSMIGDLETKKLFFRFSYKFDKHFKINLNSISILKDKLKIVANKILSKLELADIATETKDVRKISLASFDSSLNPLNIGLFDIEALQIME